MTRDLAPWIFIILLLIATPLLLPATEQTLAECNAALANAQGEPQ